MPGTRMARNRWMKVTVFPSSLRTIYYALRQTVLKARRLAVRNSEDRMCRLCGGDGQAAALGPGAATAAHRTPAPDHGTPHRCAWRRHRGRQPGRFTAT
jgi:hypothetical protein